MEIRLSVIKAVFLRRNRKMKYLILLATLISVGDSGCPSMCNCSETSVLCIEQDLESVPSFESLVNDPIIIDLSGNRINMIDSDDFSFDKSDKVIEIYLNNTELLDIDSEAFDELENLQELYLGDNLLNSLPKTLIEDLANMILLDISNNHFSGDMPQISSKSLEVLAVANSKITHIPNDSLKGLPNLKMLLLQQNNINAINPMVFEGINKNSFFVRLSFNVWTCSCDNIELFDFLAERKFVDISDPYQCSNDNGNYINVYSTGVIEDFKGKCRNETLSNQITKELSTFKEDRYVLDKDLQKEELIKIQSPEKSYSLIKEAETFTEDNSENESSEDENKIADYENDEGIPDYDGYLKKIKGNGIEITEYEEPLGVDSNFAFNINIGVFIAILCSFAVGVLFGFCVNYLATTVRYRHLESSDSRTKLILP